MPPSADLTGPSRTVIINKKKNERRRPLKWQGGWPAGQPALWAPVPLPTWDLTEDSMTEEVSAKCNDWVLEAMLRRQALLFGSR